MVGTGFILVQNVDEQRIEAGVKIINAGSALLPQDREFSAMEAESIALDRAMVSCHHWLYHCPEVELVSDCQGLLGMLSKHTADIENRSYRKFLSVLVIMLGKQNTSEELTTRLQMHYPDCARK